MMDLCIHVNAPGEHQRTMGLVRTIVLLGEAQNKLSQVTPDEVVIFRALLEEAILSDQLEAWPIQVLGLEALERMVRLQVDEPRQPRTASTTPASAREEAKHSHVAAMELTNFSRVSVHVAPPGALLPSAPPLLGVQRTKTARQVASMEDEEFMAYERSLSCAELSWLVGNRKLSKSPFKAVRQAASRLLATAAYPYVKLFNLFGSDATAFYTKHGIHCSSINQLMCHELPEDVLGFISDNYQRTIASKPTAEARQMLEQLFKQRDRINEPWEVGVLALDFCFLFWLGWLCAGFPITPIVRCRTLCCLYIGFWVSLAFRGRAECKRVRFPHGWTWTLRRNGSTARTAWSAT
jgi:hypothetical protein